LGGGAFVLNGAWLKSFGGGRQKWGATGCFRGGGGSISKGDFEQETTPWGGGGGGGPGGRFGWGGDPPPKNRGERSAKKSAAWRGKKKGGGKNGAAATVVRQLGREVHFRRQGWEALRGGMGGGGGGGERATFRQKKKVKRWGGGGGGRPDCGGERSGGPRSRGRREFRPLEGRSPESPPEGGGGREGEGGDFRWRGALGEGGFVKKPRRLEGTGGGNKTGCKKKGGLPPGCPYLHKGGPAPGSLIGGQRGAGAPRASAGGFGARVVKPRGAGDRLGTGPTRGGGGGGVSLARD